MKEFECGDPVKVLENGHVIATGRVESRDDRTGWYRVALNRAMPPFKVNYPGNRLERTNG